MANSGLHQTDAPCFDQINKYVSEEPFVSTKTYPASVTDLSEMLLQARKEERVDARDAPYDARGSFKKSHTCGSLFANCGCNNEERLSLLQTFSGTPLKRSSNPTRTNNSPPKSATKRLSSPEINNLQLISRHNQCASNKSKTWSKTNSYLNHPEIPYPIPLKTCDKQVPTSRTNSVSDHQQKKNSFTDSELFNKKANLDYHRWTAFAYEHHLCDTEEAKKFLSEFGILGPMGNGVSVNRNSKPSPEVEALQHIRKNSPHAFGPDLKTKQEDYEYIKSVVMRLKKELADLEIKYGSLQTELLQTQKDLYVKESEVLRLQREIHKLKVRREFLIYKLDTLFYKGNLQY